MCTVIQITFSAFRVRVDANNVDLRLSRLCDSNQVYCNHDRTKHVYVIKTKSRGELDKD